MENNKVNYKLVFYEIKNRRKLYFIILPIVFALSCLYIICIPRIYHSEAVIIPEAEGSASGGTSALSSLASTIGLGLGTMQSTDAITPLLYPEVLNDNGFVSKLFKVKVNSKDGAIKTDYYTYIKKYQKSPWWDLVFGWLRSKFSNKQNHLISTNSKYDPYNLSKDETDIVEAMKNNIGFTVDKKTGAITISAKAQDPYICKILVDSVRQHLQAFIIKYRTSKAENDVLYYEKLTREAKDAYERSRQRYGTFADSNTDVILESFHAKQNDLENEMQLKYNAYSTLSNQLQIAKAKLQERTPVFTLIKGAVVPTKPDSPKRMKFVLIMTFMAFLATSIYVLRDIISTKEDVK